MFPQLRTADLVQRVDGDLYGAYAVAEEPTADLERADLEALPEVAEEAVRDGVSELRVLPLFISAGGHVERDIPEQASGIEREHPALAVELLPAVGEDPKFRAMLRDLALRAVE